MKKFLGGLIVIVLIVIAGVSAFFIGVFDAKVTCIDGSDSVILSVRPYTEFTLTVKQKEKQEFLGWYTSEKDGTMIADKNGKSGTKLPLFSKLTVYSKYSKRTEFTIEFMYAGGLSDSGVSTIDVTLDKEIKDSFPVPTRAHHVFDGWFTSELGGGKMVASADGELTNDGRIFSDTKYNINADYSCNVYASWTEFTDEKTYTYSDIASSNNDVINFRNALTSTLNLSGSSILEINKEIVVSARVQKLVLIGKNTSGSTAVFKGLSISEQLRAEPLTIELENFSFQAKFNQSALRASSNIIITLVGNNEILGYDGANATATSESENGSVAISSSGVININGVGTLKLRGGNGGDGINGINGRDGADNYYKSKDGEATVHGGSGANGANGKSGANGFSAINAAELIISDSNVSLIGGKGGNGGNGGNGGKGGRGTIAMNVTYPNIPIHSGNGGNGGSGGSGGNGGNGALAMSEAMTIDGNVVMVSNGKGGNGGNGGNGSNGTDGTDGLRIGWFVFLTPIIGNAGNGGNGGNGGAYGIGGKGYGNGSNGSFGAIGYLGKGGKTGWVIADISGIKTEGKSGIDGVNGKVNTI